MNRQSGVRSARGTLSVWCVALAAGLTASAASAQPGRDDGKGRPTAVRPTPAPREAPRAQPPRASAPVAAPRPTPVIRSAPPVHTAPPVVSAPPNRSVTPARPVIQPPKSPPVVLTPPARTEAPARPTGSIRPAAPSAPPVIVQPRPSMPERPVSSSRPPLESAPAIPQPPRNEGRPTGRLPSSPPPRQEGRPTRPLSSRPVITQAPSAPPSAYTPPSRPLPTRREFDRPLASGLTPAFERPTNSPVVSANAPGDFARVGRHDRDWGRNSSVVVGVNVGFGGRDWRCDPPPRFDHCFTWRDRSWHDPFCGPVAWHDSCWARDRWGCWYVRSWHYWPSWWWCPTYYSCTYPCGTFSYVTYCERRTSWCFSFSSSPAWGYTSCGLVSPAVVTVVEPAPVYTVPSVAVVAPAPQRTLIASATPLPAPVTSEEIRSSSDRELADVYMRLGDNANAQRVYAEHVARYPGDVEAVRAYGVAMIDSGEHVSEGLARVERAYAIDPSLASRPLPRDLLGDRLSRALDASTRRAAQDNSAAAWLAVAVLMQADGRTEPARAALDKARAAGLNGATVQSMQAALPTGQQ